MPMYFWFFGLFMVYELAVNFKEIVTLHLQFLCFGPNGQ